MNDQLIRIEQERRDGTTVIRLAGEIDLSNVERLQQRLDLAVENCARVVIDLAAIEYIDSQGLRLLQRISNRLVECGTKLQLVAPPATVAREVLEMTRMGDEIELRDSLEL